MLMSCEHMLNGSTKWDVGKLKMTSAERMQQDAIHKLPYVSICNPQVNPLQTHTHTDTRTHAH